MSNASPLRIALAQHDFLVGAIRGNREKALRLVEEARDAGADLLLFPEMTLHGRLRPAWTVWTWSSATPGRAMASATTR